MEKLGFLLCTCLVTVGIIARYYLKEKEFISIILIVLGSTASFWLLIRKIFIYCLFPGTLWLFRRTLEVVYSREIALQVFKKLEKLKVFLADLKNFNLSEVRFVDSGGNKLITTLIENLEGMSKLTRKQRKLLNHLTDIKKSIEKIKFKSQGIDLDLWTLIEGQDFQIDNMLELVMTTENSEILTAVLDRIQDIQDLVKISFQDRNFFGRCLTVLFDVNLGTVDYMRSDLIKRFNCEQYLIEDKIDSLFIPTVATSSIAVIMCNPNAGFYEFTYFQSEWIEFYLSHKINIILWNYRGYGLSAGNPHLLENIKDGHKVINFYLQTKGLQKFCVHGESLGGAVAINLASHPNCCFLLADRTFGRLSDVIKYGYGRFVYWVFKLTLLPDIDNSDLYLSLNCYKLICCDPKDSVIPDIASLKTSVALNFYSKQHISIDQYFSKGEWKVSRFITDPQEYKEFCLALFNESLGFGEGSEKEGKTKEQMKTEGNDETDKTGPKKFLDVLGNIDSCGVLLRDVVRRKTVQFHLKIWLITLEIWGSYGKILISNELSTIDKVLDDLNEVIYGIYDIQNRTKNEEVILDFLIKVFKYLEETREKILNDYQDERLNSYCHKAGCYMVLNCGHGGHFNNTNKSNLEFHLAKSSVFK